MKKHNHFDNLRKGLMEFVHISGVRHGASSSFTKQSVPVICNQIIDAISNGFGNILSKLQ